MSNHPLRARLLSLDSPSQMGIAREATLVIVDMQTFFPAAQNPKTTKAALDLLLLGIERGWAVVYLEHQGWGQTIDLLLDPVLKLGAEAEKICRFRTKNAWDGSSQVEDACRQSGFPSEEFVLCGVNTHECVADTVIGLTSRFPLSRLTVVKSACNCETGLPWSQFYKAFNLRLVESINQLVPSFT